MTQKQRDFIVQIGSFAEADMPNSKILASLKTAQAILESGWGTSELAANANALFGIKADSRWSGRVYSKATKECYNGAFTTVDALFRAYGSWEHSNADHSAFLRENPRYADVIGERDFRKACAAIHSAGYATDPEYAAKLISIIEKYSLTDFDAVDREEKISMKVLIDPGHAPGNANKGANGYREYAGMWKLSNYLKNVLAASGISADLTREEKIDPTVDARGRMAKGYDLFISQHSNAFNGTVRGSECFYSVARPNDRVVAARFSAAVASLMNHPDRGAKTRAGTGGADYYGVIRGAVAVGCPHVFLMESAFHDNWLDEEFLLKEENLKRISEVQAQIILDVFGVNGYSLKSTPAQPTVPATPTAAIKAGDTVKIAANAAYYGGQAIPAWVLNQNWIVRSVNSDRAVIDRNVMGTNAINSPVNVRFLTVVG